ncbi:DUF5652 family protein [Candidatus Parcubacteria bacterium]|nr:DUF5652 family protein [Candidatus Parcubacteria bacterium]
MNNYNDIGVLGWGLGLPLWAIPFLALLMLWSMFWKGLALWHSARRGEHWWFIVLLLVNTVGILEIIYLFVILKLNSKHLFSKR